MAEGNSEQRLRPFSGRNSKESGRRPVNSNIEENMKNLKSQLKELLEPDFGLLDKLLESRTLNNVEVDKIKAKDTVYEKNEKLLEFIIQKGKCDDLITAMTNTCQTHLVNFVTANGVYNEDFYWDWPLTEREKDILIDNQCILVDELDTSELVKKLFTAKVFNGRQRDFINSKSIDFEKNQAFLQLLNRCSLQAFHSTIYYLQATNQLHIAEIFKSGGSICSSQASCLSIPPPSFPSIATVVQTSSTTLYLESNNQSLDQRIHERLTSVIQKTVIDQFSSLLPNHVLSVEMKFKAYESQRNFVNSRMPFELLPVELLDMILLKCCLISILNRCEFIHQTERDTISSLGAVNYFWFRWATSGKFKRSIWRHLRAFYKETKKTTAIIRNNRNYLMENMHPSAEFLAMLLSVHCLKEEQVLLINVLTFDRDKNAEILRIIRSIKETGYTHFISCLRQTKQRNVARVLEVGGVVVKAVIVTFGAQQRKTDTQASLKMLNHSLQDNMEHNLHAKRLISQLEKENIYILSSSIDDGGGRIVLWIWCQSQNSLEMLHEMYDSKRLQETLMDLLQCFRSGLEFFRGTKPKLKIDGRPFKENIDIRSPVVNFMAKLEIEENQFVFGVAKLKNQIYVLCRSSHPVSNTIFTFNDENPFYFQKKIEINYLKNPQDIVSNEKGNCLYISDEGHRCIWKIKKIEEGAFVVTMWLKDIKYDGPWTLSVSSNGHLLMSSWDDDSSKLLIYGLDAEFLQSIKLPFQDYHRLIHASETTKGNFIISHEWLEEEEGEGSKEKTEKRESKSSKHNRFVSEMRDGKTIIHRFIPKDRNQKQNYPYHLSVDSDSRLTLTDQGNNKVFLLDSDLKWNRILHSTKQRIEKRWKKNKEKMEEQREDGKTKRRWRIQYKEKMEEEAREENTKSSGRLMWGVSEVTRDGEIMHQFTSKDENEKLIYPFHLSFDSDDRLILVDYSNKRVILFDSNLQWKQILIMTNENKEKERRICHPWSLCYDEEKKQLMIGGLGQGEGVNVYTLKWK